MMNIADLFDNPAVQQQYSDKNKFVSLLDNVVRQMPGFVALKTLDSVYASANTLCAQLAGYNDVDSYVGTTDYDWKCEAVSLADKIRSQDRQVQETKKNWSSFNVLKFSTGRTYYFSNKSVIYFPDGEMLGVLFVGTLLNDIQILKTLNALIKIDPRQSDDTLESSVYTTQRKDNPFHLSDREEECLFYLIRGKSAKETAKFLAISPRTVETHIEQVKNKLNCSGRSEVFSRAMEMGYYYYIPASLLKNKGIVETLF